MPLDLMTLSLVSQPVTVEEGVRILDRDLYRCQYCGLDGMASFDNALDPSVVIPMVRAPCSRARSSTRLVSVDSPDCEMATTSTPSKRNGAS